MLSVSEQIAKLILEHASSGTIEQAATASGMITMNQSLKKLVETGAISVEVAMGYSNVPDELATQLGVKVK